MADDRFCTEGTVDWAIGLATRHNCATRLVLAVDELADVDSCEAAPLVVEFR